jgi:hypothetical protein
MAAYALRDGEDTILVDSLVGRPSKSPIERLIEELDAIVRGSVRIFTLDPTPPTLGGVCPPPPDRSAAGRI